MVPRAITGIPLPHLLVLRFACPAPAIPTQNAHRLSGFAQIRADVLFGRFAQFLNEIVLEVLHRYPLPIDAAANVTAIAAVTPP